MPYVTITALYFSFAIETLLYHHYRTYPNHTSTALSGTTHYLYSTHLHFSTLNHYNVCLHCTSLLYSTPIQYLSSQFSTITPLYHCCPMWRFAYLYPSYGVHQHTKPCLCMTILSPTYQDSPRLNYAFTTEYPTQPRHSLATPHSTRLHHTFTIPHITTPYHNSSLLDMTVPLPLHTMCLYTSP